MTTPSSISAVDRQLASDVLVSRRTYLGLDYSSSFGELLKTDWHEREGASGILLDLVHSAPLGVPWDKTQVSRRDELWRLAAAVMAQGQCVQLHGSQCGYKDENTVTCGAGLDTSQTAASRTDYLTNAPLSMESSSRTW